MSMSENEARLLAVPDQPVLSEIARLLVERARGEGIALTGEGGLLPALVANVLQAGLNIELDDHLGYAPHAVEGRGSGNSRNGSYPKTVITEVGPVEVQMPRDRNGSFDPVTIPKHVRRLDGLAEQVISLFAKGMTTGDIQTHLFEIYGTEISRETISKITDAIVADMNAVAEPATGSDLSGGVDRRDRDQGPRRPGRQPARVCGDRREHGRRARRARHVARPDRRRRREAVDDDAHRAPQPRDRGRVDRVLRRPQRTPGSDPGHLAATRPCRPASCTGAQQLRYASKADWGPITKGAARDLHRPERRSAELEFEAFADRWRSKYPAMIQSWENSWNEFVPFLEFPTRAAPRRLHHQRDREPQRHGSAKPSGIEVTSRTSKPR
jgi:putative transposase